MKYLEAGESCSNGSWVGQRGINRIKWTGVIVYILVQGYLLAKSILSLILYYKSESDLNYMTSYENSFGYTVVVALSLMLVSSIVGLSGIYKIFATIDIISKTSPEIKSRKFLLILHTILNILQTGLLVLYAMSLFVDFTDS